MDIENENPKKSVPDEFNRMPAARSILELLSSDVKVSPLVIDGDWGAGKTVFCEKIIHLAKSDEKCSFTPIYIDAFKADHADQPLMTLLAAILSLLPERDQSSVMEKILPALKFGLKVTGKAGVSWLLRTSAERLSEDIEAAAKEIGGAVVDKAVEAMLVEHMKADESLSALRSVLAKIAGDTPLVVFVDELDRCRPDFAVRMLEIIKHVFDVEGVKFVLVTNTRQIMAAIRHCYGSEIDAQRYLDKFVGYSFRLPSLFKNGNEGLNFLAAQLHFKNMVNSSPVLNCDNVLRGDGFAVELIGELIKYKRISLREVETFVRHFEVYYIMSNGAGLSSKLALTPSALMVYAVYCHCFYPLLANDISNGIFDVARVGESIGVTRLISPSTGTGLATLNGLAGLLLFDIPAAETVLGQNISAVLREYNGTVIQAYQVLGNLRSGSLRIELVRSFLRTFQFGCNE